MVIRLPPELELGNKEGNFNNCCLYSSHGWLLVVWKRSPTCLYNPFCGPTHNYIPLPRSDAIASCSVRRFASSASPCTKSGNAKEEPGAIVCRVAPSFLRFGSYQIHASRGKEDLDIARLLADYAIRHYFPHIENMNRNESLSFSTGKEDESVVDLTSNKYAAPFGF